MPKIGVLKKNRLKRLLRFGFYTSLASTALFFVDTNDFHISIIFSGFIFGVLVGILEEITSLRRYSHVSIPIQFLIKLFGIILIVTLIIVTIVLINPAIGFEDIRQYLQQKEVSSPLILSLVVAFTMITYFQVERLVGKNVLRNYLKGRYRKPKKEIRVFMFMDLKSSTSISEKLGNETYYSFLNDAIYEMSAPIIESKAEIYQYVGDEIVFTWPLEKGITNNNCLNLFDKISTKLEEKHQYFMKNYGYQPKFKAAIHTGLVLAAEIGHIKKDIVYTGDVLNATSRIESLCNKYQADVLVSKSLFNLLDRKHEIIYEDLGAISLKGKDEKLELIKIHLSGTSYEEGRKEIEEVLKTTTK